MANIDKTLEQKVQERIKRELNIGKANLPYITSIKLSANGMRYVFANKDGNNVFDDADMLKKEFGFYVSEDQDSVKFLIQASDDGDAIPLVVPKVDGLVVGTEKLNKKYLEVLVLSSISPLPVKAKRQAKPAAKQAGTAVKGAAVAYK